MIDPDNIEARRNLIWAAFSIVGARDPLRAMKRHLKAYGPVIEDAHAAAYESRGDCLAERERNADEVLAARLGWKSLDALRAESIARLRADLEAAK